MKDPVIEVEVLVLHTTEEAILVENPNDEEEHIWLPLSLIECDDLERETVCTLSMRQSFATTKNLI